MNAGRNESSTMCNINLLENPGLQYKDIIFYDIPYFLKGSVPQLSMITREVVITSSASYTGQG